ncbi:hypothetical protein PR202_gb22931 [Eleusine coracana subsp. coracana]|uniref:Uncharacterized protein n=1 Tax=Eleusine coracana subsp. coracana TaxID=191504 RepID=A0AAV5FHT0_ELECO|nr:hypothetical protein PR202_gb22931 [Eleusine coracana subsp. coracana]
MDGPTRPTPRIKCRCPHRIPLSLSSVHFSLAVVFLAAHCKHFLLPSLLPCGARRRRGLVGGLLRNLFARPLQAGSVLGGAESVGLYSPQSGCSPFVVQGRRFRFSVSIYGLVTTWVAVGLSVLRVSSILVWKEGTLGLQSPWRPLLRV